MPFVASIYSSCTGTILRTAARHHIGIRLDEVAVQQPANGAAAEMHLVAPMCSTGRATCKRIYKQGS